MSSDHSIFLKNVDALLKGDAGKDFHSSQVITQTEINDVLTGKREPSLSFARAAAAYFGISLDRLTSKDIAVKKPEVRLLVLDVDGVLTEGGMFYTQSGDEFKRFHTRDGMALKKLTKSGFQVAFLSSGINDMLVNSRAKLLGVQNTYVGLDPKLGILDSWLKRMSLGWEEVAYIGDDVNDLEVMKKCGFTACPSDAVAKVKAIADVILDRKGGDGCVREFIEDYLIDV